jgi:hypothetical protein
MMVPVPTLVFLLLTTISARRAPMEPQGSPLRRGITMRLFGVEKFNPPPATGVTPLEKPSLCQRDRSAAIVPQIYW